MKNVSITVEDKQHEWIKLHPRDWNFSEWVRDKIDTEMQNGGKNDKSDREHI